MTLKSGALFSRSDKRHLVKRCARSLCFEPFAIAVKQWLTKARQALWAKIKICGEF